MSVRKRLDSILGKLERKYITHNQIEVSRSALLHNLDLFTELSKQAVIPVLKGNAYGHGIAQVATALRDRTLPYIAIDGYFEALRIREVSKQPVLVMGAIPTENYKHMKYDNFAFVVQDADSIRALGKTGKKIKIHLDCNTGMNRYGAQPEAIEALTKLILSYRSLTLEGVMSHLADSDGLNKQTVNEAVTMFDAICEQVLGLGATPTMFHIAQTAGSLKVTSKYANTIRLGIGLYGINPFAPNHPLHKTLDKLKPALKLTSTITKVTQLKKGAKVSYNYTYTANKDMKIGVLPLGYFEGLDRALSNKGFVKIGRTFAPIVGRVCMNHTMINLDGVDAKVGTKVLVYSNNPKDRNAIDSIAQEFGVFNYSALTSMSPDVRRVLVA